MFVVEIQAHGRSTEVRWTSAEAVLGSHASAGIRREDVAWAAREAVLRHAGSEVLLLRGDGSPALHLRVGDAVRLGDAEISLTGLLPLGSVAPPAPAFGGYEDEVPRTSTFTLEPDPPKPRREVRLDLPKERFVASVPGAPPAGTTAAAAAAAATAATATDPAATTATAEAEHPKSPWRTETFESELVAALKRAPWFALSAVIHAAVAIVLLYLLPAPATLHPLAYGIRDAKLVAQGLESGGPEETDRPAEPPQEEAAIEPPSEPSDAKTPDDASPRPQAMQPPSPQEDPDEAMAPTALIGPAPSIVSMKVRKSGKAEKPPAALAGADVVNEDEGRASEQNRKAAAALRAQIDRAGGALGRALKGLQREDILVVTGAFDKMNEVLDELKIPYTIKSPYEVADSYQFSRHKFVFWNCGEPFAPRFRPGIASGVREFVRQGGYLFTTDWMITHLVMPAFPGFVSSPGGKSPLPEMILDVKPKDSAKNNPLLDGVFQPNGLAKWWLESSSFELVVSRSKDVEVLIESPMLAGATWGRSPAVAITFTFGRGRVLHTMGHYYQQKGNVAGTMAAQRLPLNFIRLRMERDEPTAAAVTDR